MKLIEPGRLKAEIIEAGGDALETEPVLLLFDGRPGAGARRGEWVDGRGDYGWPACSECGKPAGEEFLLSRPYRSAYCPACGARMLDGEEKGE